MCVFPGHDRSDTAAQANRAAFVEMGAVAGRAGIFRGAGALVFARFAVESVGGAGGAALPGTSPHSIRPVIGHRRQLPGRWLPGLVDIVSRGGVGLLDAALPFAVPVY